MGPGEKEYVRVLAEVRTEYPDFTVVYKDESWLMRVIGVLLFFNSGFMTRYVTTIGSTLYVPSTWDKWMGYTKATLLRHERVHLRQQDRYGMLRYTLMYLLLLPTVVTYRAMLEREAYAESIRAKHEYGALSDGFKDFIVSQFTTGAYLWMWPFRSRVERWYDEVVDSLTETPRATQESR